MAIVTWPLSSGEARGRVGDLIYNTWRGRSYVKAYTLPKTEFSLPQVGARAITALCTDRWHAISDAQREAWEAYAHEHPLPSWTGQPKRLTAYNWFIKLNWFCQARLATINDDPPIGAPALLFVDLTTEIVPPDVYVTWIPQTPEVPPTWWYDIWLEGPYAHPRAPSIKRALYHSFGSENDGYGSALFTQSGFYTLHIRLVHNSGIAMPFTPIPLDYT